MELYKSLDDKLALLDEAIRLGDGDAILTVGLFLVKIIVTVTIVTVSLSSIFATSDLISFLKVLLFFKKTVKYSK